MRNRNTENPGIRKRMRESGIGFAKLSDALGVAETTLYRWMRHELTAEQRQAITTALEKLEGVA